MKPETLATLARVACPDSACPDWRGCTVRRTPEQCQWCKEFIAEFLFVLKRAGMLTPSPDEANS